MQTSSNASKADFFGQAVRVAFHDAAEVDIRASDLMGPGKPRPAL
jgi:hypothetical protein